MYSLNELEIQRTHREELMREAENGRLARRLRSERASGVRSMSLDRAMDALRAALGRKAGVRDCEG